MAYDKDCDHIYGNMAKWPRKCFRCGGDEAEIQFDRGFEEIEKAIERGKTMGERHESAIQDCIDFGIDILTRKAIEDIAAANKVSVVWLKTELAFEEKGKTMICNLTDLQCHLIQCGAKFSDSWIRDIEEALAYHRLKSTVDAERAEDSKTIRELADALKDVLDCITGNFIKTGKARKYIKQALSDNAKQIAEAQENK